MMMRAERLFTVFAKILILMMVIMITGMATVAMTIMLYLCVHALGRLESNPLSAHSSRTVTGLHFPNSLSTLRMEREFRKKPVFSKTDADGVEHNIYVMYHATPVRNVKNILDNGFKLSTGGIQGPGLYLSMDTDRSRGYGVKRPGDRGVCFKVLVYTGKTKKTSQVDTTGSWRNDFDTAFLPSKNTVVKSGKEETCVKSTDQVRILGVAYGHGHLDSTTQGRLRDREGSGDDLDHMEEEVLKEMIRSLDGLKLNSRQTNTLKSQDCLAFLLNVIFVIVTVIIVTKFAVMVTIGMCKLLFDLILVPVFKLSGIAIVVSCFYELWRR